MFKKLFILFKIARKLALSDALKVISKQHTPPFIIKILLNLFSISFSKNNYQTNKLTEEEKLCSSIQEMGTTFIKLGQFLSTRPDIIGEDLSLLGAFDGAFDNAKFLTILSTIGIVIGAAYFLGTLQRIFLGQLNPKYEEIEEINAREIATLLPLGILTILLGVWPHFIIDMFDQNVDAIVKAVNASSKAVGILP